MAKLEVKHVRDSEQNYYFDMAWPLETYSKALTINHSLKLIQSFKTILLKTFCMHTKVLMFQYTYTYHLCSIDSLYNSFKQKQGVANHPRKLLNCVQESQYLSISKRFNKYFMDL